jgi:methyl-accepting chemotaxis protein
MSRITQKIEFKIIIPIILFMLISAGVLYVLISMYAENLFNEHFEQELEQKQKAFSQEVEHTAFESLLIAESYCGNRLESAYRLSDDSIPLKLQAFYNAKKSNLTDITEKEIPYRLNFYSASGNFLHNTEQEGYIDKKSLTERLKTLIGGDAADKSFLGIDKFNGRAVVFGVSPAFSGNGSVLGYVEAYIPLAHISNMTNDSVAQTIIFLKTDESDSDREDKEMIGDFVADSDTKEFGETIDEAFLTDGAEENTFIMTNDKSFLASPIEAHSGESIGSTLIIIENSNPLQSRQALLQSILAIEVFWLILVFVFSYILIRAFVGKPIKAMTKVTQELSKGDLRTLYRSKSNDEIGFLSDTLNKAFTKISNDLASLKSSAENVYYAGDQLNHTSQNVSQGSSEQAASVEEVSASMEEMSANIENNNNNAQITEKEIFLASASVYEGSKSVKKTAELMKSIDEKIRIVDQIAKQTNILALNASVEAANAGEAGEGFSVIAREIRELAEKSRTAAIDIRDATETGVSISEKSNKELTDIVKKMEGAVEMVKQITTAGKEQKHGVEQVNGGIEQLNKVTQQNAAVAEEMATNAEELVSQSEMLKNIVAYYQMSDDAQVEADADLNLDEFRESETTSFHTGAYEQDDDTDDSFESFSDDADDNKKEKPKPPSGDTSRQGYNYNLDDNNVSDDDFEKF